MSLGPAGMMIPPSSGGGTGPGRSGIPSSTERVRFHEDLIRKFDSMLRKTVLLIGEYDRGFHPHS